MGKTTANHVLSGYRLLWMFVFFDLPVGTKDERAKATGFRNHLLDLGFEMSQFSVYLKMVPSKERAQVIARAVEVGVPSHGKVDILTVTDKQFENIISFTGRARSPSRKNPDQLILF